MEPLTTATLVTIALFMAGVIFQAGRTTARLESIEAWRKEVAPKLDQLLGLMADRRESH